MIPKSSKRSNPIGICIICRKYLSDCKCEIRETLKEKDRHIAELLEVAKLALIEIRDLENAAGGCVERTCQGKLEAVIAKYKGREII